MGWRQGSEFGLELRHLLPRMRRRWTQIRKRFELNLSVLIGALSVAILLEDFSVAARELWKKSWLGI